MALGGCWSDVWAVGYAGTVRYQIADCVLDGLDNLKFAFCLSWGRIVGRQWVEPEFGRSWVGVVRSGQRSFLLGKCRCPDRLNL